MEICDKCQEAGEDRRSLWMSCMYEMHELKIAKLVKERFPKIPKDEEWMWFYTLRVCKKCRGDWMRSIQEWFNDHPPEKQSCGSGIFIRENGDSKEITREEFYAMQENKG